MSTLKIEFVDDRHFGGPLEVSTDDGWDWYADLGCFVITQYDQEHPFSSQKSRIWLPWHLIHNVTEEA